MRLQYKLWLDYRGRAFGDGPARLLAGVQEWGSLRKAAQELGMSYNKAWRILHAAEQRLGFPLLDRSVGGSLAVAPTSPRGAGPHDALPGLATEADEMLEHVFQRHFADWQDPAPVDVPTDAPADAPSDAPEAASDS
jgi:molybdate transport system regulatory protein